MVFYMAQAPMFRINQLSKDLGIKTKELQSILEEAGIGEKTPMTVLTPDEFNLFLDCATKNHQIKNLDAYLNGKTYVPRAKRRKKPARRLRQRQERRLKPKKKPKPRRKQPKPRPRHERKKRALRKSFMRLLSARLPQKQRRMPKRAVMPKR